VPNRAGETAEFIGLLRETQAPLRGFVRMLGVSPDSVDDIAQETYLVAFERFAQFDRGTRFLAWLRTIARNIVMNEKRKDARRRRILNERLTDHLATQDVPEDALSGIMTAEIVAAMNECLEELPQKHRTLVEDRYANDENASVLGARLRKSAASIRQALMTTRATLQQCIERKVGEITL
jgi:RNA polymerase sigma-70 factor (ECF subfamily)